MDKVVKDHLGNEYKSFKAMADYYNINCATLYDRLKRGMTLEEALTIKPRKGGREKPCKDHLGNEFSSLKAMAECYNISAGTLSNRLRAGVPLEEAFIVWKKSSNRAKPHQDHLGNVYESKTAMAEHYNITLTTLDVRLKKGETLEQALTGKRIGLVYEDSCQDHLGNTYESFKLMAKAYDISPEALRYRINKGLPLEEALTKQKREKKTKPCQDHLGNTFNSKTERAAFYNMSPQIVTHRLKRGMTLEEALTRPMRKG